MDPTVSVIIPTYGRPRHLADALKSVYGQTYPKVQVVVVDDASQPPVTLPSGSGATLVRHARNLGPGAARNSGLAHAVGQFVLFLDDDDLLTPHRLQIGVEGIGDARIHISAAQEEYEDGRIERDPRVFAGDMRQVLAAINHPGLAQAMLRREDIVQFSPRLRVAEDKEWWIAMADRAIFAWSDEVGVRFRRHDAERPGVDAEQYYRCRLEILRAHRSRLDRRARARMYAIIGSAAFNAGWRIRAVAWSLAAVVTDARSKRRNRRNAGYRKEQLTSEGPNAGRVIAAATLRRRG